jgi:hypothetical protein
MSLEWINKAVYTEDQMLFIVNKISSNIKKFCSRPDRQILLRISSEYNRVKAASSPDINLIQLITLQQLLCTQESINSSRNIFKYRSHFKDFVKKQGNRPPVEFIKEAVPMFYISPIQAARLYLTMANSATSVKKWFQHPKTAPVQYRKLILWAYKNDSESPQNALSIMRESQEFENKLIKWLKKQKMDFKTQEDLVIEQTKLYGRAIITPDVLFTNPITIKARNPDGTTSEHKVKWIDAKNFILAPYKQDFIEKKIKEQADKYVAEYGPGAFVFHYGFTKGLSYPGCVILDGSFL